MCDENNKVTMYSHIYPFTTENITGYLSFFDLENKSLLTVGSSCDQALNAILCGSRDITVFDICPFTKEYYYLKKAAIKTLKMEEYLKFFCYKNYPITLMTNKKSFNFRVYLKISEALKDIDEEAKCFWDEMFMHYNGQVIRRQLFNSDEAQNKIVRIMNNYLWHDDIYNELIKKIDDASVKFMYGDIFETTINGNYDNIFLSNIATRNGLAKMQMLFSKMEKLLNDDGKILIAYLYDISVNSIDYAKGEPEIYDLPKTLKEFPYAKLDSFIGANGIHFRDGKMKDSILTYKKVKKI